MTQTTPKAQIGHFIDKVTTWNPRAAKDRNPFHYIDLSSIDREKKEIIETSEVLPSEAPSRARQLVQANDVLVATVRPNLNGVAVVPKSLSGATASTGFCVLRPKTNKLDHRFLFHWVKNPLFVCDMVSKATGANYPAVSDKSIKDSKIPLPPLSEQKRIAAILDKVDGIRRKRQEALRLADAFLRSVFLDMFGDPVTNPKGWEVRQLGSALESIIAGWSAKGEDRRIEKNHEKAVLKISAVTSGRFNYSEHKVVTDLSTKKNLVHPLKGDLLFSRANTRELVAATCIVDADYHNIFLPDKLWKITTSSNEATPEYIKFLLSAPRFRDVLTSKATGTSGSMLNISKQKFISTSAPIPPLDLQKKFSTIFWRTENHFARIMSSVHQTDEIFSSLSQRAFRGEL